MWRIVRVVGVLGVVLLGGPLLEAMGAGVRQNCSLQLGAGYTGGLRQGLAESIFTGD